MSELQTTRYDRLIRRVGGIIGPGSKVGEAISELFPMIDVERVPGELLALQGTILGIGSESLTAGVGDFSAIQLFNPVDSGNIVTVSQVILNSGTNHTVFFGIVNTSLSTNNNPQRPRDSRIDITIPLVAQVRREALGAAITAIGRIVLVPDDNAFVKDENSVAMLLPGFGLQFTSNTSNLNLIATFFWRERPAQPSELSL